MCVNPLKNPLSGVGLVGSLLGGNKKKPSSSQRYGEGYDPANSGGGMSYGGRA
jgi:hypothetical protein